MAALTATSSGAQIGRVYPNAGIALSYKAPEAITAGATVCFDLTAGTVARGVVYNIDISDSDRRNAIGIALETVAAGEEVAVGLRGCYVTGYTFTPSSEATHRNGAIVYTADAGLNAGTQATGAIPFGYIVPVGNGGQGIFVDPIWNDVGA